MEVTSPNPWEDAARWRKAWRLAVVLDRLLDQHPDWTVDRIREHSTPDVLRETARLAGTRVPSAETWALVLRLLTELRDALPGPPARGPENSV